MESSGGSSTSYVMPNAAAVSAAMPSPSNVADTSKATQYEFDPSVSEEERRFYLKAYPTVDVVRERKTHCTVCKVHIGTAPVQEHGIKMHPILRVTHCNKCHDFYNSGEFSKGEDGSELYCRWCGQGGEVYCCSSCPYVFCKSCIVKNLSRGVVADIEQNENWNCFSCAPKILWPLRAQHWALMNYIEQQKKEIYAMNLSETETKQHLAKDRSKCCRLAKAKCGNMSDSMESLDSITSKRSHASTNSAKKPVKHPATPSPQQIIPSKRTKNNDEVVCTPDLLSMLEPDCQITVSSKTNRPLNTPSASTPKIMSIQQPPAGYGGMSSTPKSSIPPPLVLRNTAVKLRTVVPPPIVRRTIIGPRTPNPSGNGTPVYHTINGYRIDLNSAAQQETFRLPNGKLIQVKRQGPPANISPSANNWQQINSPQQQRVVPQTIASRPVQVTTHPYNISVQQQQSPQVIRYHSNIIGSSSINSVNHNGGAPPMQVLNGQMSGTPQPQPGSQQQGPIRPVMVRHVFPDTPIGRARSGLQDQVFNAMDICTHLTNKVQTLTNSNAYKQARNYLEVKELYIHLSYLLTYAVGRFKSLQDKCLGDMRTLGFGNDADSLENGQLAADKQASDDEENEIEIVEPKTDLITLDSDDEESPAAASTPARTQSNALATPKSCQSYSNSANTTSDIKVKPTAATPPISLASRHDGMTVAAVGATPAASSLVANTLTPSEQSEVNIDFMSLAQNFLASMLEVDTQDSLGSDSSSQQKKQPRKKLTNKPNPTLLKQKALMERERLEEMKRNDQKLKMKCLIELKKAEEEYPFTKDMLEARAKEKLEIKEAAEKSELEENLENQDGQVKLLVATDKETVEVELIIEDETPNSSSEMQATDTESSTLKDLYEIVEKKMCAEAVEEGEEKSSKIVINNDNVKERNEDQNEAKVKEVVKENEKSDVDEIEESSKINLEFINELNVKTAKLIENEEDNNKNGGIVNDEDAEQDGSNVEIGGKESLENVDNTTKPESETETDIDVEKEIAKVLRQQSADDANDNESIVNVCNTTELANEASKESSVVKEIETYFKSKENTTVITETTTATTSNGSI